MFYKSTSNTKNAKDVSVLIKRLEKYIRKPKVRPRPPLPPGAAVKPFSGTFVACEYGAESSRAGNDKD
jgi:hypothetical protein